ncbi:MAG: glycohydrolase toxin TNT-related protein, partial [Enterobacteriaceae bacterium]
SVNVSRDKMHSNYDSEVEQTGIYAGKGGYDVTVGEHTQLNGAVIGSTATADKNRLDTGTIGFSDIENRADFEVEHQSVGMSTGGSIGSQFAGNMANGLLVGANRDGHDSSTTHAAVSDGTLIVRDPTRQTQDINQLSRDVEHANQTLSPIFDKEKEQERLQQAQLIGEIGNQVADIARTEGSIRATNAAKEKLNHVNAQDLQEAKAAWEKANPGKTATLEDINGQIYQTAYNDALSASGFGTGGQYQQAIQAATAAVQGLAGSDLSAALAGGAAPYVAEVIGHYSGLNDAGKVAAHAVVNAALAAAQGQNALAGAAGAATGELVGMIATEMYGKPADELDETQKQTVSALATLAAGLSGGLAGDSSASAVAGAQAGKTTVDNNYLSVEEAERKRVLERKEQAGNITPDEKNELTAIGQLDKARDLAIKSVCTDGNKGGAACRALIGPAEEALKKYGKNVTYSLLYKDLYPQDAKNVESVLQGLDAGSITRDQAITAIAKESHDSWENVAKQYDTVMQAHALTSALAGFTGLKGMTEKPTGPGSVKPTETTAGRTPEPNRIAADEEAAGWSQYDKYRNGNSGWNWPEKLGFAEAPAQATLPVGTRLDRYGNTNGAFLSPLGTPQEQRALAPGTLAEQYHQYEVIKPLPVIQGKIAPAFGEPGGGIQILPNMKDRVNVQWLLDNKYIRKVN